MTLDALTFTIVDRDGKTTAFAVVSTQARYASTLSVRGGRIDRRFATPAEWRELEHHVSTGPAHIPAEALAFLTPGIEGSVLITRWLYTLPIEAERPEDVAGALDWHLQQQANELRLQLKLRQEGGD
jgi:hypothetical protein